jgi:hypothetical protein
MGGELHAEWDSSGWPQWQMFEFTRWEMPLEQAALWKISWEAKLESFPRKRVVFLPYYWLFMSYLVMWAGVLIWRKRKYDQLRPE